MTLAFQRMQQDFTQLVRGKIAPLPLGASPEKMALYNMLALNNIRDVIGPCFPMLTAILPKALWSELLEKFLANHHATTPLFHQVAKEFVSFLKQIYLPEYPFIQDLAHYEWTELDVEIAEENKDSAKPVKSVTLLDTAWQIKSAARLLHYPYDVENIGLDYQPQKPIDTFLIVYRDSMEKIQFIKLNQLSYSVLLIMQREKLSARQVIQQIASFFPSLDLNHLVSNCSIFIASLFDEGIFQYS